MNNKDIIITAAAEIGVSEVSGDHKHNLRILEYFRFIGKEYIQDDETAWCSAFVNFIAKTCGRIRSGELNARSWLNIGQATETPEIGDIVIFWRDSPDSWKGHVGFYFGYDKTGKYINVLGGNQGNKVCFKLYHADRVLGFRKI